MTLLLYLLLPLALLAMGGVSLYRRTLVTDEAVRGRWLKLAVGSIGSACIIWSVYAVSRILELVVIVAAIAWLCKRLALGPTLPVRLGLFRKKLG